MRAPHGAPFVVMGVVGAARRPVRDGDAILELRDLGHRSGDFEALRGLGLRIEAGEGVALIGHNGSGSPTPGA